MLELTERGKHMLRGFDNWESLMMKEFFSSRFSTDIEEKEDSYVLTAELPGFQKEDIAIDVSGNTLTVKAEHREEKEERDEGKNYIHKERSYGGYTRSFSIEGIDVDHIKADYQDGILMLTMPKAEKEGARTTHIPLT